MIIERFLYEDPEYTGMIDREKIIPPYNSDPIPEIEDQHYLEKEYNGAMYWLMNSMRFETLSITSRQNLVFPKNTLKNMIGIVVAMIDIRP